MVDLPTLVDIGLKNLNDCITVVGDLHGQFPDLQLILSTYGFPSADRFYIFNGDFVDRGPNGCEVLFTLYLLKVAFPHAVFLNRGNHEDEFMNERYDFKVEVEKKYDISLYEIVLDSFDALPLYHVINGKHLVLHGGLSELEGVTLDEMRSVDRFADYASFPRSRKELIATASLWSDPREGILGVAPSERGAGVFFGSDVSEDFCTRNGLKNIIRSHEQVNDGFLRFHGGRVLTIFSCSNYTNKMENLGAVIKLTKVSVDSTQDLAMVVQSHRVQWSDVSAMLSFHTFINRETYAAFELPYDRQVVEWVQARIFGLRHELLTAFSNLASSASGSGSAYVTVGQWADVLGGVLGLKGVPWRSLAPLFCEAEAGGGMVDYRKFCLSLRVRLATRSASGRARRMLGHVALAMYQKCTDPGAIFEVFDADGSENSVSYPDFLQSMKEMELAIPDEWLFELFRSICRGSREGALGFGRDEFLRTFKPHFDRMDRHDGAETVEVLHSIEVSSNFKPWEAAERLRNVVGANLPEVRLHFALHPAGLPIGELGKLIFELLSDFYYSTADVAYLAIVVIFDAGNPETLPFDLFLHALHLDDSYEAELSSAVLEQVAAVVYRSRVALRRAFMAFDADGDGVVTREEFRNGLTLLNAVRDLAISEAQIDELFEQLDVSQDGVIQYEEFLACFSLERT